MKKIKKAISAVLAFVFSAIMLPTALAETSIYEKVLYEDDFNTGTAGSVYSVKTVTAEDNNPYLLYAGIEGNQVNSVSQDGELGIATTAASGSKGRTFLFDFTKGDAEKNPGITEGVYKLSYDFAVRAAAEGNSEGAYGQSRVGINMNTENNTYNGGRMFYMDYYGLKFATNVGNDPLHTVDLIAGQINTIEIIMDFDKGNNYYYLNGEYLRTQSITANGYDAMANLGIGLNGDVSFFDNLKISKLSNTESTVDYTVTAKSGKNITVNFDKDIAEQSTVSFEIKNSNNETFAVSDVDWKNLKSAKLTTTLPVGTYTLTVSATDYFGNSTVSDTKTFEVFGYETVMYENTFDNGELSAVKAVSNDYLNYYGYEYYGVFRTGAFSMMYDAEFNGNKGVMCTATPTVGRGFWFDFTKGNETLNPGLSEGVVKISFEAVLSGAADSAAVSGLGGTDRFSMVSVNANTTDQAHTGTKMLYIDTAGYRIPGSPQSSVTMEENYIGAETTLDNTSLHVFELILDFDNNTVKHYVDGKVVKTQTSLPTPVKNIGLNLNDDITFFDNLKISKLTDVDSFGYDAAISDDNTIVVYFGADVKTPSEVVISVTKDDVSVAGNIVWTDAKTVKFVTDEKIPEENEYVITLTNATDIFDNTLEESVKTIGGAYVLYENNFDDGVSDLVAFNNEVYNFALETGASSLMDATVNENKGIAGLVKDGRAGMSWAAQFAFDFTKGGEKNGISEGKVKLSFDASISEDASAGNYTAIELNKTSTQWICTPIFVLESGYTVPETIKTDYLYNYKTTPRENLDAAEVYSFDIVMNFDDATITYYIEDTEVAKKAGLPESLNNLNIHTNADIDYLDNVKLTCLGSDETLVTLKDGKIANAHISNNSADDIAPVIVGASYDEEGRMVGVVMNTATGIGAGESGDISVDIGDLTGTIKVFVAESFENLAPITDTLTVSF